MAQRDEDLDLDVEAAPAKKRRPWGKIALFGGIGVLVIALSVTVTLLLLRSGHSGEAEAAATPAAEVAAKKAKPEKTAAGKKAHKTPHYLDLDPPFVVNLDDDSGVRFLQVAVSVMSYKAEDLDKVKENMPVVRHYLMLLFSSQKFADIKTREGKVKLQAEALATIRKALTQATGEPLVQAVYLPSVVGQ
jgi:flagellar protein FliL